MVQNKFIMLNIRMLSINLQVITLFSVMGVVMFQQDGKLLLVI